MNPFKNIVVLLAVLALITGCKDPNPPKEEPKQVEKKESIIGKWTDEIHEFKPGVSKEADLSTDSSSPLYAATAGAYKYAAGTLAMQKITVQLEMFNAEHGRYPASLDEFTEKVIKANQIELPVLNVGLRYEYDVENHALKVVEAPKE